VDLDLRYPGSAAELRSLHKHAHDERGWGGKLFFGKGIIRVSVELTHFRYMGSLRKSIF